MNFSYLWGCADDWSLLELSRAAAQLGRGEEARSLLERAREAGSAEAKERDVV